MGSQRGQCLHIFLVELLPIAFVFRLQNTDPARFELQGYDQSRVGHDTDLLSHTIVVTRFQPHVTSMLRINGYLSTR